MESRKVFSWSRSGGGSAGWRRFAAVVAVGALVAGGAVISGTTAGAQESVDIPEPAVSIVKTDAEGNDANSVDTQAVLPTGSTELNFTVTNSGREPLNHITVTDTVVANGTVTGLSCVFPDGSTGTTWEASTESDVAFEIEESFPCTAQLDGVVARGPSHKDIATVTAAGYWSELVVADEDPYFATTSREPSIAIVKGDSNGNAADDAATGPLLGVEPASAQLEFTVTNDGNEALVDVTVTDAVVANGDVANLNCVFPDKSTGTTWAGPFAVSDSFDCTANLSNVASGSEHHDVSTVVGKGKFSGTSVTDDDPYFAHADKPGTPTNPTVPGGVVVPSPTVPVPGAPGSNTRGGPSGGAGNSTHGGPSGGAGNNIPGVSVPGGVGNNTPGSPSGNTSEPTNRVSTPGESSASNPTGTQAGGRIDSGAGAGVEGIDLPMVALGGLALLGAAATGGALIIRRRRSDDSAA